MRLYGFWRSSSAWRVRIALAWKAVPCEGVPVGLLGGEQLGEAHRARNPLGQVPVLEVDGRYLGQSMAILEYLEERFPEPPLLPADPFARAKARQLAEMVNSGIQPLQNLGLLRRVEALGGDPQRWGAEVVAGGLAALERAAAETAGDFLVGDAPSFADVLLVPQLYNARRFGLDLGAFPVLSRADAACASLPAFQAAHPDRQPDAPSDGER